MDNFLQQLINGITLGSIYGLIAIGYTMVFGIIGMVNFAHGDVFMLSAFIAMLVFLFLTKVLGLGYLPVAFILVLVAGMVLTSVWNWTIERLAYRPLRGSFRLAPLISAIGMSTFLSNFVQVAQGPRNKPVPPMFTDIRIFISAARVTTSRCNTGRSSSSSSRRCCCSVSGGWCRRPTSAARNAPASRTARWPR